MTVEEHPLTPFLPKNGRLLFLGSFPPPKARWSMDWFYPNWINDFWRIQGLIHFGDKQYFEDTANRRFDYDRIVSFCTQEGLALFDTARKVCRLKDNADDNYLQIIERTDILQLLSQMPHCQTIVTTGGKASEELCAYFQERGIAVPIPKVGSNIEIQHPSLASSIVWWRMPSTSRAYPMKLEKKADVYRLLF